MEDAPEKGPIRAWDHAPDEVPSLIEWMLTDAESHRCRQCAAAVRTVWAQLAHADWDRIP